MLPPSPGALGGHGPLFLAVSWLSAGLATIMLGFRLYTGVKVVNQTGWNFYWALIAYVLNMVMQVFETLATLYGIGQHVEVLTHNDRVQAVKYFWIGTAFGIPSLGIAKLAVIALLFKIQGTRAPRMKWVLYAVAIITNFINAVQVVIILNQCSPSAKLWDPMIEGNCNMLPIATVTGKVQSIVSVIGDFVLGVYPIFILYNVQIAWQTRVGLCSLLGVGILATSCGIGKIVQLKQTGATKDYTYAIGQLSLWAFMEMWLVVMLSCVPPLRPLFFHFKTVAKQRWSKKYPPGFRIRHDTVEMTTENASISECIPPQRSVHRSRALYGSYDEDDDEEEGDEIETPPVRRGEIVVTQDYKVEFDHAGTTVDSKISGRIV
ncbi:Hypothetical protein R9X50_00425000 [Acrodontium crateriforme]|uniref:Rhodopsin domain-containing protein n=1 Tax=Acrodontium crateriforme TaxID=150365 RepID=A0AAQ3M4Z8_9PEZI|nr:Hypothetical protein R9X50_00425000 [Acrodontium crateriforme]